MMNNKYQETLERLCKVKIYQKEASAYDYLGKEIYKEEIKILQELVDKTTPAKPIYENDLVDDNVVVDTWAYCPNCKEELDHTRWGEKYCSNCGQKLDWSDMNE